MTGLKIDFKMLTPIELIQKSVNVIPDRLKNLVNNIDTYVGNKLTVMFLSEL